MRLHSRLAASPEEAARLAAMTPDQLAAHRREQREQNTREVKEQIDADYAKAYGDKDPMRLA